MKKFTGWDGCASGDGCKHTTAAFGVAANTTQGKSEDCCEASLMKFLVIYGELGRIGNLRSQGRGR